MRVLFTSILCQAGLMTHVRDLAGYLERQGIGVVLAFQEPGFVDDEQTKEELLAQFSPAQPCLLYHTSQELREFALSQRCELIHAHSYATFKSAAAVSQELGMPLVLTLHSIYRWERRFKRELTAAERIIAVGPGQAEGVPSFRHKLELIPNGIDIESFAPAEEEDLASGKIRVLWYGRVHGNCSRGLLVLDQLAPELPSFIELSALGSADFTPLNIPLLPWTNNPIPHLQRAHLTFAQSRALREAMACGSVGILLGSGYGGLVTEDFLLKHNLTVDAFYRYNLPKPRVKVLLADLLALAKHPQLRELRREARRLAVKYFDLETMGQKTLAVYNSALQR